MFHNKLLELVSCIANKVKFDDGFLNAQMLQNTKDDAGHRHCICNTGHLLKMSTSNPPWRIFNSQVKNVRFLILYQKSKKLLDIFKKL